MLRAYKYRIYPTKEQKIKIDHALSVCRLVYNLALQVKIEAYRANGTKLTVFDLCYQLAEMKQDYEWIRQVDSQALQASVKKIDVAFKNFFRGSGYPKFKKRNEGQSFSCPNNARRIDFENQLLTIPKIPNIPIRISRTFNGKIKTITIGKTPSRKYSASVLVQTITEKIPAKQISPETTIGIDVGIKSFVVTSDGRFFEPNRKLKNSLKRLQCLQRRTSRKIKGSNNRKKAKLCVAILHEKITNQRTDYIHKITTGLIRDNQAETFVIENLGVAGMLKNRKLSQALSDVSFGEFFRQMKYKCEWYGKNLITIGRFEPSSKTCSDCGGINETLTLSDREWICSSCGTIHDRDFNAAKNIRNMGLKKHSGMGNPGEPMELSSIDEAKR